MTNATADEVEKEAPPAPVVLVPRGGSWGASVAAAVAEAGLTPWVLPLIETIPTPSEELSAALQRLQAGEFDWVTVTSAAAVPALADVAVPERTRVAAVGQVTARTLREAGLVVDLIGDGGAPAMLAAWPDSQPGRVLAVQSDIARPVLVDGLVARGWSVDAVVAYRTASTRLSTSEEHAVRTGKADVALVTSGSVGRALAAVGVAPSTRLVAIGDQTAHDMVEAGLPVAATADTPTIEDLLRAAREVA